MIVCTLKERTRAMADQTTAPMQDGNGAATMSDAEGGILRRTLFSVEHVGQTLIIVPTISGGMFRYAQLQTEANALRRKLDQTSIAGLILDLHALDYLGTEVIGAVVALARKVEDVGGRAVLCRAAPQLSEALTRMGLHRLWRHFPTREEALEAIQSRA
jgi:anti-anti-sigma factor